MFVRSIVLWGPVLLVLLAVPVAAKETDGMRSPLGQSYPVYQPAGEEGAERPATVPDPEGDLSLEQALKLTMRYNAELAASAWEIEARSGEELQAGLLPNPEFSFEAENFAGQNDMRGYDAAETTLSVSQLVELGGKRGKRQRIAGLERQLSAWDHEAKRLDILTAATKAYIDVVAAQQRVEQTRVLTELASAIHRAVRERVEAGKVSPLELTRATVELSATRLENSRARKQLEAARKVLASFWGGDARFGRATEPLKPIPGLPPFERLLANIDRNPDLARWTAELERRKAERSLAEAEAVPDLTLSVGVRNFQETNDNALVAIMEFPLMLFDRNQGGRKRAVAEYYRTLREQQAAKARLRAELAKTYQELKSAYDELQVLEDELLPGAEQAFEAANFGYREGKFGFIEMVDTQRTLFEIRGQYVDALANYHKARADIERLIARSLTKVTTNANTNE